MTLPRPLRATVAAAAVTAAALAATVTGAPDATAHPLPAAAHLVDRAGDGADGSDIGRFSARYRPGVLTAQVRLPRRAAGSDVVLLVLQPDGHALAVTVARSGKVRAVTEGPRGHKATVTGAVRAGQGPRGRVVGFRIPLRTLAGDHSSVRVGALVAPTGGGLSDYTDRMLTLTQPDR